MKKIVLVLGLLFLNYLSIFGQSDNSKIDKNEFEKFKKDNLTLSFRENFYSFIEVLPKKNVKEIDNIVNEANLILEKLYAIYGKENVELYFNVLGSSEADSPTDPIIISKLGTHDGNPCTRNTDGTTYWGACSFWEGVSAYFAILGNCGYMDITTSTPQEWENYAKCNQAQICKHC